MPLRLYWNYPHMVGRFQEVTLFTQAGIEVVCAKDHLPLAEADANYHNEMHELYPAWRKSLTLASNICEEIRAFNPYETKGQAAPHLQDLINDHIDIIYAGGAPEVVEGLGQWFKGSILYRVMGFPNWVGQQINFRRLNSIVSSTGFKSRFVLACGYQGLVPNRYGELTRDRVEINGWVDAERVTHHWAEAQSERCAVTAISYLHFHSYFRSQYVVLAGALNDFPLKIVGKNDKARLDFDDPRIVGELDFSALYKSIADARVFVDAGHYPNHLIWPPVEAAMMGVPVLFVRTSGLVDPLRAAGYDFRSLYEVGMFDNFADLNDWLARNGDDIALLAGIARRQRVMFAEHTFGRQTALKAVKQHIVDKPWNFANPARVDVPKNEKKNRLRADQSKDSIVTQELSPLMLDSGEARWFMPQQMRTLKGRIERRNKGRPTLVLDPKTDQGGQVVETFLPPVTAGWYIATLMVEVYEGFEGPVLEAELGRWDGGTFVPERAELNPALPGLAELEFDLTVHQGTEDASRELRVLWSGKGSLGIIGLRLDAAPYPAWLGPEHRP